MDGNEEKGLQMVNVNTAAEILGVSRRQVYRLVEQRAIPHMRLGGCVRFERGVLEQWIRDQMMKGVKDDGGPAAREPLGRGLLRVAAGRTAGAIPPHAWGGDRLKAAG